MIDPEFSLDGAFPARSFDEWKAQVLGDLRGEPFEKLIRRTYEEIDLQPLYWRPEGKVAAHGLAGDAQPRGLSWLHLDLRMEHDCSDLERAKNSIDEDLANGATSLLLRLGKSGIDIDSSLELERLLADVDLREVAVAFDADAGSLALPPAFPELLERRGIDRSEMRASLGFDPFGILASIAEDSRGLQDVAEAFEGFVVEADLPFVAISNVNTSIYHHAGANAVQELGVAIATGLAYLKIIVEAGLSVEEAAGKIEFSLCVSEDFHLSIAKLRAARRLWRRVLEVCGAPTMRAAMRLNARVGRRRFTPREIRLNLVRNAAACFAAMVGGADSITPALYDCRRQDKLDDSRRLARNTMLVLAEEASLETPAPRLASSWFLDEYARRLAEAGWKYFQRIESRGGMYEALVGGWLAKDVLRAHQRQAADAQSGELPIVGWNLFVDDDDPPSPAKEADDRRLGFPERPLAVEAPHR